MTTPDNAPASTAAAKPRAGRASSGTRTDRLAAPARLAMAVLAVALGFFFVEFPANDALFSMDAYYVAVNLGMLAVLFALVYFAGQRSRAGGALFLAACLLVGVANHFVIAYKGQPVVPADLFALSTAAAVSGGYSFLPDARVLACLALYALACVGLHFVPKAPLSRRAAAANLCVAAALAVAAGAWMNVHDIGEDFHCVVGEWNTRGSYAEQGTVLCFLQRVQELVPRPPEGYSPEAAAQLLAETEAAAGVGDAGEGVAAANMRADRDAGAKGSGGAEDAVAGAEDATADIGTAAADAVADASGGAGALPSVVAVMNESFSDLARFESLAGTDAEPARFREIARGDNTLAWGTAYASAFGAGTCNSEFEFLTGSSMGHFGADVYPYVLYDLNGNDNLAAYLSSLGYATCAAHPADATNWRRDRVYAQLGFDAFHDIAAFDGADTLRGFVTDRETYDFVLGVLESSDQPQFVFDVTIQNHGGYATGLVPDELAASAPVAGASFAEMDEYAACLRQSDEDLAYFVERLQALEEPVVVCFFGDHQPAFEDDLTEALYGTDAGGGAGDVAAKQERYEMPYLIWANDAALALGAGGGSAAANADAAVGAAGEAAGDADGAGTGADEAAKTKTAAGADAAGTGAGGTRERATSLNYLGVQTLQAAGIPLDGYWAFLEGVRERVPALNLNGFMDATGAWHAFDEDAEDGAVQKALEALRAYRIVQYANLFG